MSRNYAGGTKQRKQQTSKTTTTHKQTRQGKVNGWPVPQRQELKEG